jgi:hypothetical protein
MGDIEAALAALERQNKRKKICIKKVADKYGIERSTLLRHWHRVTHLL